MTSMTMCRDAVVEGAAGGELRCEVATSFEALSVTREQWDALVAEVGGDVYLTYDWCRTWWEFYGRNRALAIFVFRVGRRLAGVAPMLVDRVWLGPLPVRIAKLVGSDFGLSLCDPPVAAAWARQIFDVLLAELVGQYRCDAISFPALSGRWEAIAALREAATAPNSGVAVAHDYSPGPHMLFFLPGSFEEYLAALDKRQRGNYRRDANLLSKSFDFQVRILTDAEPIAAEFPRFQEQHAEQWARDRRLGHFRDWPRATEFHQTLVRRQAERGRSRLVELVANGQIVSYQYCYSFAGGYYWFMPARASGPEWDRYGLGRMGLMKMLEAAIGEGAVRVEAGPAHYSYKAQLGGKELPRHSILLVARRPWARARLRMYGWVARLLNLAYYRVWFMRVAPRLPLPRRPLWSWWIRTRV